jgi:hypothetical protein
MARVSGSTYSERQKKISASMRTVDEETRRFVHKQRVESLEEDNFLARNRM